MNRQTDDVTVQEIEELEEEEQVSIRLINVIFLPFHPAVRLFTLVAVIAKSLLGPFVGTYPQVLCASESEITPVLYYSLRFYQYFCDITIGIDLFLHIVHRQVVEEASKREFAPKSLIAIWLDLLSLIPFLSFIVQETCAPSTLWPNIMGLTESLCFYRVIEYFDLKDTHSIANIFIGYTLTFAFLTNLVACVFILLTYHGLCSVCAKGIYDWRLYFKHEDELMDSGYNLYNYALQISVMNLFFIDVGEFKPATYIEYLLLSLLIIKGFLFIQFVIGPKIFAEIILKARTRISFHIRANRIIEEANKRNMSSDGDKCYLEKYFSIIWKKMEGVTVPPGILADIPRYMKLHMKEDISWAVFHHSPTLRRTSTPYKRWLYDHMVLEYRMPGERLYSGRHCYTHLYYLKAGIVQLISAEDGATPVLSVTGGSLFGDISFFLPPLHRQTLVRCLTYCEIIAVPRDKLLNSMYKFPEDRSMILKSVNERIKHAKTLYSCKSSMRGLDRTKDEGLAWLKTRWWDLWNAIQHWKKSSKKDTEKCKLPTEKSSYHCSKYIGQLVLCKRDQLQLSTIFAKVTFPWILSANSSFTIIWNKIVKFTVVMVLILLPPNIAKEQTPDWFDLFIIVVDIVYIADLFFNVITNTEIHRKDVDFKVIVVAKLKSWRFMLDVVSTAWLARLLAVLGHDALAGAAPLARLFKLHVLFDNRFDTWKKKTNVLSRGISTICLFYFSVSYVTAYLLFITVSQLGQKLNLNMQFLFGPLFCSKNTNKECESSMTWLYYYFMLEHYYGHVEAERHELWIQITKNSVIYFLNFFATYNTLARFYLKYHNISRYNCLVTSLKWVYIKNELHPDALKRVERYFLCQWKHNHGMSILQPNAVQGESQSAYWAYHGRPAERVIGASRLFANSHPSLIKDLAEKSRFSLVPQGFTLILFGVQDNCITWIINGELKCEYKNEVGVIVSHYSKPEDILMLSPLFPGLPSFKTYVTATDCEILYLTKSDFLKVMKQHIEEWSRINECIDELSPIFDEVFREFLKQHQSYQKKLQERIFHDRKSVFSVSVPQKIEAETPPTSVPFETFISNPESPFVHFWVTVRMFVVLISIVNINVRNFCIHQGLAREILFFNILSFCDFVGFADIALNLFLPYFDDRGLIVSDYKKCIKRYLTRCFLMDLIGTFPWKYLMLFREDGLAAFAAVNEYEIYMKYAHLYMLTGYLNYLVDKPCGYRNYVLFMKWQLVTFLVMLAAGNFYFCRCFEINFHKNLTYLGSAVRRGKSCWNPSTVKGKLNQTSARYPYRIIGALEMALDLMFGIKEPEFDPQVNGTPVAWVCGLLLQIVFWFVALYSQTLLMLNAQTNVSFHHGVQELVNFLKEERVEKPTIDRCVAHYNYIWLRTKGVSIQKLYSDIGTGNSLTQDINFYVYNTAYKGLNTIFNGGEILERKLSGVVTNTRFLPNEEIVREMDLIPFVFIVNRGKVVISRRGRKLATLTTGGLFGQISGTRPRPVRISACTEGYTDVLQLSIEDFQDIFAKEYKDIVSKNTYDFIRLKKEVHFVPILNVEYLIRGIRIIKLPFIMSKPVDIRSCLWYERFLYVVWIWLSSFSLFTGALDLIQDARPLLTKPVIIADNVGDALFLIYYITEFFTDKYSPILLKLVIFFLTIHTLTCFWMRIGCKYELAYAKFHYEMMTKYAPEYLTKSVDWNDWTLTQLIEGCRRKTQYFKTPFGSIPGYAVAKHWYGDYLMAFWYILTILVKIEIDALEKVGISRFIKIFIMFIIKWCVIWISSEGITFFFMNFNELYAFERKVEALKTHFKCNGLSKTLLAAMSTYTKQLWKKQRGSSLPKFARKAPQCLKQDIFGSLYMHHLRTPMLFQVFPEYFLRQLAVRLTRKVVFPGNYIVQEGDIHPTLYFIHEGEVEKWCTDAKGESKMSCVLTMNGYFGLVPAIFPNAHYQFAYYSRTVVDLICLNYSDWQDLLDAYPDIKANLYKCAKKYKHDNKRGKAKQNA